MAYSLSFVFFDATYTLAYEPTPISLIKLNSSNQIIAYNHEHNYIISEKKAPRTKAKSEIKNKLQNLNNPLTIKAKNIYEESTNNLGLNIPEYNSLRYIINRNINNLNLNVKGYF